MSGMNPGFAAYLAAKKAGKAQSASVDHSVDFAPPGDVPKGKSDTSSFGTCPNCKKTANMNSHSC